jgi:hypothetical protein
MFFVFRLRNTKLIILSHVKPIDASYEFHASFTEPPLINVDKQQDLVLKIFFSSNHSYSEQIIIQIIDEERNRFALFFTFNYSLSLSYLVSNMKFMTQRIILYLHVIRFYGNQRMIIKLLYNPVRL